MMDFIAVMWCVILVLITILSFMLFVINMKSDKENLAASWLLTSVVSSGILMIYLHLSTISFYIKNIFTNTL